MIGILVLTSLAFTLSIIIVIISSSFKDDEKIHEIIKRLPGYNCGACGLSGCEDMAVHILKDKEFYKRCNPLKGEALRNMEEYVKNNL